MLTNGTDEFVIAGILRDISADLAVSPAAAGQLITVFAVAFGLGAPLLALITDQLPRRALIVAALAIFAMANAAAALAPGYWPLMGHAWSLRSRPQIPLRRGADHGRAAAVGVRASPISAQGSGPHSSIMADSAWSG